MSVRDSKRGGYRALALATGAGARRLTLSRRLSRAPPSDHKDDVDGAKLITEVNALLAFFRDLMIHVGQNRDCPELRDKIRKVRRQCVDVCKTTNQVLLPQVKTDVAEGIPVDNTNFVHLFCLAQLLIRELRKCERLLGAKPMDMGDYFETRNPSTGITVLNQIILCRQLASTDFNEEEQTSIQKERDEVSCMLSDMQEYMPKEENGKNLAIPDDILKRWQRRMRRRAFYKRMGLLCVLCRSARSRQR